MNLTIKGASTEKLYQELGIEHLRLRRWFSKLCLIYRILLYLSPPYLFNLIPNITIHTTGNSNNITTFLQNSFFFFSSVISEWSKFDLKICNSASLEIF